MNKWILMLLASLLFGASACNNDINTNADYKEIMIVYGLLNVKDTGNISHYVRVNRAFLTQNQSALDVAKVLDTSYFNAIEVKIDEFDGSGQYKTTYILKQDRSVAKDSGIFASEPNVVFSFKANLNADYLYKLTVTNKTTGKTATSETSLVHDPTLGSPSSITTKYLIDTAKNLVLVWTGGKNSKVHDLTMRFYWNEYDMATNQLLASNLYIDWPMVQDKDISVAGTVRSNVSGGNFYTFLAGKIPVKQGIYRQAQKIDFIYWAADDEFDLYRKVNQPGVGIVQKKPEYTNISNGNFGLFASRNRFTIEGVTISDKTVDFLQISSQTRNLNFRP